ncbi:MAG: hypothetical protein E6K54_08980 [Gammaproteobacteria bacterium]|nr:MAG: hypothetical protein E6K54_08980 [Gammaproteobacteria bacterium]
MNNISTFLTTVIGIGFGWILNEFGQWFRTRREDRKVKKKMLYLLLETYYTFNKLDTAPIINEISKIITEKLPPEIQTEELQLEINKIYHNVIDQTMEDNVSDEILDLEESYKKGIEDLAFVDPITAYRLKGKNDILETFDQMAEAIESIKKQLSEEEKERIPDSIFNMIKPELLKTTFMDLEEEIKKISRNIGPLTHYRSKKVIRDLKSSVDENRRKEMQRFFDKILPM